MDTLSHSGLICVYRDSRGSGGAVLVKQGDESVVLDFGGGGDVVEVPSVLGQIGF